MLFLMCRYFVLNFVDYDLSKVIKRGRPFTEEHIKLLIYSLLRGLKFIHSAGVIHRVRIDPTFRSTERIFSIILGS